MLSTTEKEKLKLNLCYCFRDNYRALNVLQQALRFYDGPYSALAKLNNFEVNRKKEMLECADELAGIVEELL